MELASRVVLLTGARRIGQVIATELASRQADIVLGYRSSSTEAEATAASVRALGRRCVAAQVDVSDASACTALVARIEREFGRLDVLINMASLYQQVEYDVLTQADWHRQLSVDLHGTFVMSQAAVPLMKRSGGGRIINFTDWVAASGRPRYRGYLPYYVAKAGVKALTEALALELAGDRILVNAIAPGPILAPDGLTANELEVVAKATPLGQWGGPMEIAKAVLALIDADFITGETIRVDGGRHIS
ncbi:MAG: SDR family oxidoreductase [Vicinamibacterales bacterium]